MEIEGTFIYIVYGAFVVIHICVAGVRWENG